MQLPSRMSATWAPRHRRKGTGDGVADERYASFVGLASQPLLLLSRLPRLPQRAHARRGDVVLRLGGLITSSAAFSGISTFVVACV